MTTFWVPTYAYLSYALAILLAIVAWLGALIQHQLYHRVGDGRLDESWLELAHWLAQNLRFFSIAGGLLTLVGLLLAVLTSGEPADVTSAHKSYLLRLAAITFAGLCLGYIGSGDLSRYHLDLLALVVCGWALWGAVAGWRALAGGVAVAAPALWWLGLVFVLLVIARFIVLFFFVSSDSPHQF